MADTTVTIVMKMRDEASQKLSGFNAKLERTSSALGTAGSQMVLFGGAMTAVLIMAARSADSQGRLAAAVSRTRVELKQFVRTVGEGVLPVLLISLNVLTKLLEVLNKLPGPLIQIGAGFAVIATSVVALMGSVFLMIKAFVEMNKVLRINIALQAIMRALSGVGIGTVAAALAVGAGTVVATGGIIKATEALGGGGGGINNITINTGAMMGNETEARAFARRITDVQREERRIGR